MWDVNQGVRVVSPIVVQQRHTHSYMHEMHAEVPMYLKAGVLVAWLDEWTSAEPTLELRILALYIDLYEHGILEEEDVILVFEYMQVRLPLEKV